MANLEDPLLRPLAKIAQRQFSMPKNDLDHQENIRTNFRGILDHAFWPRRCDPTSDRAVLRKRQRHTATMNPPCLVPAAHPMKRFGLNVNLVRDPVAA